MNQAGGIMYKQREIVLVPFPYSDLSSAKRRPVLIVSNDDYNKKFQDVVVCVITSNQYKDAYSLALENEDLKSAFCRKVRLLKLTNFLPSIKTK